jgi:hypothetical protein
LVSWTVKDLVAGSAEAFADRRGHTLKDVPDTCRARDGSSPSTGEDVLG